MYKQGTIRRRFPKHTEKPHIVIKDITSCFGIFPSECDIKNKIRIKQSVKQ